LTFTTSLLPGGGGGLGDIHFQPRSRTMDPKELRKILAGLGMATLVSAVGVAVPGHLQAGSG
jgi:radical SAM modification target selenobiotic family peptide